MRSFKIPAGGSAMLGRYSADQAATFSEGEAAAISAELALS